ncbi:MAG: RHS repeat protein [Bacteroidales bacterium]|nr:RHS repeat protein [Bacteroidales bacterium]
MKQTLVSLLLCLISILSAIIKSYAQDLPKPVSVLAPTTLQHHLVNIDMTLNTGTVRPSIPLQKISYQGIDIDLSIYYNGSGIRTEEHPGWVGQNWSLSAGGSISRMVVGLPDELTLRETNDPNTFPFPDKGFFYHHNELSYDSASNEIYCREIAYNQSQYKNFDYQPDIFSFNFLSFSGKFFMGNDGELKVISQKNLKIIIDDSLVFPFFENWPNQPNRKYPKVIAGIKIIDGHGNMYLFGYAPNAIEYNCDFFSQSIPGNCSNWIANSWHLTKVIDKFGTEVFGFEYTRGNFITTFSRNDYYSNFDFMSWPTPGPPQFCPVFTILSGESAIHGTLISPIYLKTINYLPDSSVLINFSISATNEIYYDSTKWDNYYNFLLNGWCQSQQYVLYYIEEDNLYSNASLSYMENLKWMKLDSIIVHNGSTRKFEFIYNNKSKERLNLLELRVHSEGNGPTSSWLSYYFLYNSFQKLPGYLSNCDDHWGYFNGSPYNIDFNNFSTFFNMRNPNPDSLLIGMLNKVVYPTGSYTRFEFEPHDYSTVISNDGQSFISSNGIASGVRIKAIIEYDGEKENRKHFKYTTTNLVDSLNFISSGELAFMPKYYWDSFWVPYHFLSSSQYALIRESTFSVNSIIPFGNYLENHIIYSEVVQVNQDSSYIKSKYSSFSNGTLTRDEPPLFSFHQTPTPFIKRTSHSLYRGLETERYYYTNQKTLTRKELFQYSNSIIGHSIGANLIWRNLCSGTNGYYYYLGTTYQEYAFRNDLALHSVTDYLIDGKICHVQENVYRDTIVEFEEESASVRNLRRTINFNSSGESTITSFKYPIDLPNETYMQELIDDFGIDEPIFEATMRIKNYDSIPIGVKKFTYKLVGSNVVKDKSLISSTDETDLVDDVIFDKYSNEGLLLQYSKHNSFPITLLWDNTKNYLMAEIENSQYSLLSTLNYKPSDYDSETLFNSIQTLVPNATIKTYSYKKLLGLTAQTNPAGQTTYYEYDLFGRLKYIKNHHGEYLQKFDYHYKTEN